MSKPVGEVTINVKFNDKEFWQRIEEIAEFDMERYDALNRRLIHAMYILAISGLIFSLLDWNLALLISTALLIGVFIGSFFCFVMSERHHKIRMKAMGKLLEIANKEFKELLNDLEKESKVEKAAPEKEVAKSDTAEKAKK